jgi:hypothetical protein
MVGDSIRLLEYDATSGVLIRHVLYQNLNTDSGLIFNLRINYFARDTLYSNQLYFVQQYFVLGTTSGSDTIRNISYQYAMREVTCESCPSKHNYINEVVNFSYDFSGSGYKNGDTVVINK